VKLTREQYNDLQRYLAEFRAKLNQTKTSEEAVPIFKDAVVELNKYELLPKGMSVKQAQKLVTGLYQNKNRVKLQERLVQNHVPALGNNSNILCMVAGKINDSLSVMKSINTVLYLTQIYFVVIEGLMALLFLLALFVPIPIIEIFVDKLLTLLENIFWRPIDLVQNVCVDLMIFSNYIPIALGNVVGIGEASDQGEYIGSTGWVKSFGLYGNREWNGTLYGRIRKLWIVNEWNFQMFYLPGIIGFSGIKLSSGEYKLNKFYLGSARYVNISSEPPPWPPI
jgi:hypothetical protein